MMFALYLLFSLQNQLEQVVNERKSVIISLFVRYIYYSTYKYIVHFSTTAFYLHTAICLLVSSLQYMFVRLLALRWCLTHWTAKHAPSCRVVVSE